ncbi:MULTISPECIES: hypothetical protein [unclassified Streptomyces]|uniref:hypothetical protein n=1 Tax=unclassified Streptomyces TaxID=2593676 RepID=UPI001F541D5F|nr:MULTISPECIES: hypothetical protein [unclassified Streptomyces]
MFSLTDPGHIQDLLAAAGFQKVQVQHIRVAGKWGADTEDATAFMLDSGPVRHLLDQATPASRTAARQALTAALHPYETDSGVWLHSSSWLVTAIHPAHD